MTGTSTRRARLAGDPPIPVRSLARRTPVLFLLLVLLALTSLPFSALAGKKKKEPAPHALLFGSVFTQEGLALPGVPVTVKAKDDRKPRWRAVSDRRGEFAIRVPPGPGTYEVTTESKDRKNETKTVEVLGQERVDVFFRLPLKEQKNESKEE